MAKNKLFFENLKNMVETLSTSSISTLKYYIDIELEKRLKEKIIEMSPEENEVKLAYPIHKFNFTDLEDAKNSVVGVKLEKFANDYHMILAVLENGKTDCLTTLNNFHEMLEILQKLEDMTARVKYEEKAKEPVHFENEDIIITDPCYIMKKGSDDWGDCDYGSNMEVLGFTKYKVRDTLYGDWSCTTFNIDTKEPIGNFCADAGEVGVFSLKEVLKYNPEFDYHTERKWTTTLIENFTGDVRFIVEHTEGEYEDDSPIMEYIDDTHTETKQRVNSKGEPQYYHRKGDKWEDNSVHVIGEGNINFRTEQTGF